MSAYAKRIRALRLQLNLSQTQLAELAGVSQNQISRYERETNDLTGDVLVKLARALNTSTDYLLGVTDDSSPNLQETDLAPEERKVIAAWRRGDRVEAAKIILNG